jgi:HK97 family phage prohead protease
MPFKSDREYRDFRVEAIAAEGEDRKIVRGYASTFENAYTLYDDGEYVIREIMDSHAFDDTDMSDTIMQYNHEGRVFARVSNGTLRVAPDEQGLAIEGDLGGTSLGAQIYEEVAGGYTDKMSVGMKVDKQRDVWTTEELNGKTIETRRIMRVARLYDVSAVSIPANDATSISVRTLVDGEIERLKSERAEAEKRQKAVEALKLKIKLSMEE